MVMDSAEHALRLELWAEPDSVAAARHALSALAERLGCDAGAVRIAVSELVGNSVIHAYHDRDPGPVLILGRVMRGRLVITVADRGRGMIVRTDSPGLGVGLPVVSKLANDLRIDSDDAGTAVSVSFGFDGATTSDRPDVESQADVAAELRRARTILHRSRSAGGRRPLAYSRSR
jgi:anti-sigma regulatory factor (Ser/Thr protein kinase)